MTDSDGNPLEGRTVTFTLGTASGSGTIDATGPALATLRGPPGAKMLRLTVEAAGASAGSSDPASFTVTKEDTVLTMPNAMAPS